MELNFSIPQKISDSLKRPVGILGGGVSGQGVISFLERHDFRYIVYDEKDSRFSKDFLKEDALRHSLVITSPSFHKWHPWVRIAEECNCLCINEIDFASIFWPGRILAITGTNGKTTLTEFLTFALNKIGLSAYAVGNNGVAFSRIFELGSYNEESWAICEVSSFQSERLDFFKADAVIWTNFAPDHLEVYSSLREYFFAKANVFNCLKKDGRALIGESVKIHGDLYGLNLEIPFVEIKERDVLNFSMKETAFNSFPQRENYLLASEFWKFLGLNEIELKSLAKDFELPEHRLSEVAVVENVHFWDDSKATNFAATLAALKTFSNPVYLIAGGKSKGEDISQFVKRLKGKVKKVFLLGETALEMKNRLLSESIDCEIYESLEQIVKIAFCEAKKANEMQEIVLSPGFSSLDIFKSYAERGEIFIKAVRAL